MGSRLTNDVSPQEPEGEEFVVCLFFGYSRLQKFGEKSKIDLRGFPARTPEVALDKFCNY